MRRQTIIHTLLMSLTAMMPALTLAQSDYPAKAVRLVVPFAPGGSADLVARVLAQKLGEQMPTGVLVENRAGANMNIGADYVAKSTPDGYTALYNTSNMIFNISMYASLPYDAFRDFAPVALTATVPQVLVLNPSLPATNLQEFIAYSRSQAGRLNYASVGVGAISHLTTVLFLNSHKITALHIPYTGSPQAYADLIGGRTQFYFATVASAAPFLKDNRVRAIAVTSLDRSRALPDVPTLNESGMPKFEATSWQGMLVPGKTPPNAIFRLNTEILKALKNPDLQKRFDAYGTVPLGSTPQEYGEYMKAENLKWGKIIKDERIKAE